MLGWKPEDMEWKRCQGNLDGLLDTPSQIAGGFNMESTIRIVSKFSPNGKYTSN